MSVGSTHTLSHSVVVVDDSGDCKELGFFDCVFQRLQRCSEEGACFVRDVGLSIEAIWVAVTEVEGSKPTDPRTMLLRPLAHGRHGGSHLAEDGWSYVQLAHNVKCAFRRLIRGEVPSPPAVPLAPKECVLLGTVVLIEAVGGDEPVALLTKRGRTMRTFAGLWVLPGGHPDAGESMIETGIREVMEETGVELKKHELRVHALWESVYPLMLESGAPVRHHVVVCMRATFHCASTEVPLKLEEFEVEGAAWMNKAQLRTWAEVDEEKGEVFFGDVERYVNTTASGPAERVLVPRRAGRQTDFAGFAIQSSSGVEAGSVTRPVEYDMHDEWMAAAHRFFLSIWCGK